MEKSNKKTTPISLETNQTENFSVQERTYDCTMFYDYILSSEKPTVTISPKPHPSLIEGKRLTLTCQANEATKEIRWTKDGVAVSPRAKINLNTSTLVIEKVLTNDSGEYSCRAINNVGSASSSVNISVRGNNKHKV